jgi:hypothetical protein
MVAVRLVHGQVDLSALEQMAAEGFGDLLKAVVDVNRRVIGLGGDLHSDAEAALLEDGSEQAHLWGINLYPDEYPESGWIEFDSLINIRPSRGNRSRDVEDQATREAIRTIVGERVAPGA